MPFEDSTIPLIVVEEHHEAFYVWHYAIAYGWMRDSKNTLLHVDAHSDFFLPYLRRPIGVNSELFDVAAFVYTELDVSNFIWPAVYQGIFNRVLWLRDQHRRNAGGWRRITISAKNLARTEFVLSAPSDLENDPPADVRSIHFSPITAKERFTSDSRLVLDIDLDYFCCNDYPNPPHRRIEITKVAYDDFQENPYHILRLMPGAKVTAEEQHGRYYLVCHDFYSEENLGGRQKSVERKMRELITFLDSSAIQPDLIVVCRSIYSGYTPIEYAGEIERKLMDRLGSKYQLKIVRLDSILPPRSSGVFTLRRPAGRATASSGGLGIEPIFM